MEECECFVELCGCNMEDCGCNVEECRCNVEECECFLEECGCFVDVMGSIVEECGCFVDVMWNIVEECGYFVEKCGCNLDPPHLHISQFDQVLSPPKSVIFKHANVDPPHCIASYHTHVNISQSNIILYKPLTVFIFNSNESVVSRKCSMKMKDLYLTLLSDSSCFLTVNSLSLPSD